MTRYGRVRAYRTRCDTLPAMMAAALEGVTHRFGARTALSRITLSLEPGTAVGLLGPNGAGKTTALRLLLGFTTPTEGQVRLRGIDPREPEARRGVGYLPERLAVPARATLRGFLRLHADLAGVPSHERDDQVRDVMEMVGVADRSGDRLAGLSKGLRQRVGFAQAFLGAPTLLLFDEPTSGLDPIGIRDARSWIAAARERGCTVLGVLFKPARNPDANLSISRRQAYTAFNQKLWMRIARTISLNLRALTPNISSRSNIY